MHSTDVKLLIFNYYKTISASIFFFICYFSSTAQENFITVWDMCNSGTADNDISFNITTASGSSVTYCWNSTDSNTGSGIIPADTTIATVSGLPIAQIITLSIELINLKIFTINNTSDRQPLTDITQWGALHGTVWKMRLMEEVI